MTKEFLYLLQSRADMVPRNLSLESSRADLLIYTWDEKIEHPNALFKTGTVWAEGLNILIEAARKFPHTYKYYIMMDDDVNFINGDAQDFEDEILAIEPDACIPFVYWPTEKLCRYKKFMPFRYLSMNLTDNACLCLSKELFFSDKLMPYHTQYGHLPVHKNSNYSARYFWIMLFEHYSDRKLLVTKNIQYSNLKREFPYSTYPQQLSLLAKIRGSYPNFKNKVYKNLYINEYVDKKEDALHRISNSRKVKKIVRQAWCRNRHRYLSRYLLNYTIPNKIIHIKMKTIYSKNYYNLFKKYLICFVFIYRDIKINIKIIFNKIK